MGVSDGGSESAMDEVSEMIEASLKLGDRSREGRRLLRAAMTALEVNLCPLVAL